MKKAVIPGSYDPITLGHLDIIERAAKLFDEVTIMVSASHSKNLWFSPEDRKLFCEESVKHLPNVKVAIVVDELVVRYARNNNINYIARGLRINTDFEYELQLSQIYKSMDHEIESIWFPTNPNLSYYSSSIVRELIKYNESFDNYVPEQIIKLIKERIK